MDCLSHKIMNEVDFSILLRGLFLLCRPQFHSVEETRNALIAHEYGLPALWMMLKSTIDPILAIPDDAVPGSANAAAGGGGGGNGRDPKTGKKLTEQQQQQNAAQV
jgi:hypothetical protein